MSSYSGLLFVYVLGGITFIPVILAFIFLHAFFTLPAESASYTSNTANLNSLKRQNDDGINLKSGADTFAQQFTRKHESDVAAGYFAVCREYVPGGINGSKRISGVFLLSAVIDQLSRTTRKDDSFW